MMIEGLVTEWVPGFVAFMLWLTVVVSLGSYAMMWLSIIRIDAPCVASLFYLVTPVTMLMAWVAFSPRLIATDLLGLAVAAAAVVLAQIPGRGTLKSNR